MICKNQKNKKRPPQRNRMTHFYFFWFDGATFFEYLIWGFFLSIWIKISIRQIIFILFFIPVLCIFSQDRKFRFLMDFLGFIQFPVVYDFFLKFMDFYLYSQIFCCLDFSNFLSFQRSDSIFFWFYGATFFRVRL